MFAVGDVSPPTSKADIAPMARISLDGKPESHLV
jgi:hypothetical protein